MEIFPFLIFILILLANSRDRRHSDMIRWIILGCIGLAFLSVLFSTPLGILAVIGIGIYLWKKYSEKAENKERAKRYGWNDPAHENGEKTSGASRQEKTWTQTVHTEHKYSEKTYSEKVYSEKDRSCFSNGAGQSQTSASAITSLPKRAGKRRKILDSFNRKYDLLLTEEQMTGIVNSSYMSEIWRKELEAMAIRYENVYEWLTGPTDWLRTYMYVFHIQEITSDIRAQEEICKYSFESVFQYVDTLDGFGLADQVRMVNQKYMTSFDDITFMIAYRFLEKEGLSHDLNKAHVPEYRMHDEAEDLTEKYL